MHSENELDRLLWIITTLRERCAWTRALTHESLRTYLIEEAYEVLDAIGAKDADELCAELGDLLFQILLHSQIAAENQQFDLQRVAKTLGDKLLRRNRHVFDAQGQLEEHVTDDIEEIIRIWNAAKQAERDGTVRRHNAGLPAGLPSLTLAQKLSERHSRAGTAEIINPGDLVRERITDSDTLGKELLALTARAQELGLDAESVLRETLQKNYVGIQSETSSRPEQVKR